MERLCKNTSLLLLLACLLPASAPAATSEPARKPEPNCVGGPGGDCYELLGPVCKRQGGAFDADIGQYRLDCLAIGPAPGRSPIQFLARCSCVQPDDGAE